MDEMDQADQELRLAIGRSWPFTKRDGKLDLLVPPPAETGPNKLTVGKIFGGMLILENWKLTRFGTTMSTAHKSLPVSYFGLAVTLLRTVYLVTVKNYYVSVIMKNQFKS